MEVLYANRKIAEVGAMSFSGSGNPIIRTLPQTMGSLINPSLNQTRSFSAQCLMFLKNHTKNQMEQISFRMNQLFSSCTITNRDLFINDNLYENISIVGNSFTPIAHNERLQFTLNGTLAHNMPFLDSEISANTQTRHGRFVYEWVDAAFVSRTTEYPIINNYEAAPSINFVQHKKPRNFLSDGQETSFINGFQSITIQCWIAGCPVTDIESYLANALVGPLGRQGTLEISGATYDFAVLNNVSTTFHKAGTATYTMEFIVSPC